MVQALCTRTKPRAFNKPSVLACTPYFFIAMPCIMHVTCRLTCMPSQWQALTALRSATCHGCSTSYKEMFNSLIQTPVCSRKHLISANMPGLSAVMCSVPAPSMTRHSCEWHHLPHPATSCAAGKGWARLGFAGLPCFSLSSRSSSQAKAWHGWAACCWAGQHGVPAGCKKREPCLTPPGGHD